MKDISSFYFIFIGDTHGFIDDFKKQKEIIELVNPDFVLSELLQDYMLDSVEKYNNIFNNKQISEMVSFEEVKDLLVLCHNKKIKLIGIDFRNFGFNQKLRSIIKGEKQASKEDEVELEQIIKKRQLHHLDIINRYKNLTKRPIVIIIGSWHLIEESLLMKELDNYLIIYPCDKDNKLLIKPTKENKNIRYCKRIKR